jgi:hypothetical protein
MDESVFDKLLSFVERERWKYKMPLSRSTRLVQDLKMDGDDAYEFMEKYVSEFNLDYSAFNFDEYFSKEGFDLFGIIASIFKKKVETKKTLTLGDLERAIIRGKLE